jgi:hypothetical protein
MVQYIYRLNWLLALNDLEFSEFLEKIRRMTTEASHSVGTKVSTCSSVQHSPPRTPSFY